MIRIKTLSLPLISALVASTVAPASAQVALQLNSNKTYRQYKGGLAFKGGAFVTDLSDGHVSSIGYCNDPNYYPPGTYIGICSPGTSGFITEGVVNGATVQRPYLLITELVPAVVIQPYAAEKSKLIAAPASDLPRPAVGFREESATISYNLHIPSSIRDYNVTHYFNNRNYTKFQRSKFESEIVTGAYHYTFPRLGYPDLPAPVTAVIYPMVEGLAKINNQVTGFEFTSINKNRWNKNGFVEMSYASPNTFRWSGLTPSTVYAAVDSLYFSLKALRNPKDPENSELVTQEAIFPAFNNGSETRVLLTNPYISSYTTPPVFPSGTKAMVQLELQRTFQTGGVTYDFSNRKFQIPVVVVDRFSEYAFTNLAKAKDKKLLSDPDKDGYNNLTEWILESDGSDTADIPEQPVPAPYQAENIIGGPTVFGSYFGFNVEVKRGTVPAVSYTLQRSKDQGKTWKHFKNGYYFADGSYRPLSQPPLTDIFGFPVEPTNWQVQKVTTVTRGIIRTQIQVRSLVPNPTVGATIPTVQPAGTVGDLYRVKVVLAK